MRAVYCPVGFAHGFCVVSDVADVMYKQSNYYADATERGIAYNDPDVAIEWPLPVDGADPVRSATPARRSCARSRPSCRSSTAAFRCPSPRRASASSSAPSTAPRAHRSPGPSRAGERSLGDQLVGTAPPLSHTLPTHWFPRRPAARYVIANQ